MVKLPEIRVPELLAVSEQTLAAVRAMTAVVEQLHAVLPPTPLVPSLPDLRGIFENLEKRMDRLEQMLLVLGWPPPGHLPATLLDEITDEFHAKNLTPSDVEELFVHFYNPTLLEELTTGWRRNGHFPHRIHILEAAVSAHVEGKFELSVPTMLPQIEGVIADLFGHVGRMNNAALQQYLVAAFGRSSHFDRVSAAFILNVILEGFWWGAKIPRLSRHAILHGADTGYATAAKSLQVILAFDELQRSISYVASIYGTRFHVAACSSMRGITTRRIFHSIDEAWKTSLLPCRRCLKHLIS